MVTTDLWVLSLSRALAWHRCFPPRCVRESLLEKVEALVEEDGHGGDEDTAGEGAKMEEMMGEGCDGAGGGGEQEVEQEVYTEL